MTNSAKKNERIVAGLDIGSTKVACAIGVINSDSINPEKFDIVGVGTAPSTGMRQGVVVNIEATTEAIRKAREEAELMSGYEIDEVWVGVAGSHISSFDSRGMVAIKDKEVTEEDIERVIEAAKAVAVPADREVIHVLPREYKIDEQGGIYDPIGMSGVRLEASVHIVTGGQTALQNAVKCTEKADLKVSGLVLQQLASSLPVLSQDEKNLGVAVVDMGGGICDSITYVRGSIAFTTVIPVGGSHFTHDVAVGLRTPQANAEILKKKYGAALVSLIDGEETIEVPGVGGREERTVKRRHLCEVIEPRAEETLTLIHESILASGMVEQLGSGVVLTGGASQLDGLVEMGEYIFDVPVRRGAPSNIGGLTDVIKSPDYSTAVGLVMYGIEQDKKSLPMNSDNESVWTGKMGGFARRIKNLLNEAF